MLLELLRSLTAEDWEKQTVSRKWKVKDVAAHLLDTPLRGVSIARDGYLPEAPRISSSVELAAYINRLNEEGVRLYRRLSPAVLISLMQVASQLLADYHRSRDPDGNAPYGVSWAGEEKSANWFDTAREFTERWHHQQQIRDASGRPGLYEARLFAPVLDAFVRALPHTFCDVHAAEGTAVQITISGPAGGEWVVRRAAGPWELLVGRSPEAAGEVVLAGEDAWKIFTRGIRGDDAMRCAKISGNRALAFKVLEMVSVIA